jgi:glycosyltransferase involved in cell wall biosynthesis
MQKISIIIPAHNEENRIGKTLETYSQYLQQRTNNYEFVVVLNGCSDNTYQVVHEKQKQFGSIVIIDLPEAGKGLAIKAGFADALVRDNDLIGFVDADMATEPRYFYDLIEHIGEYDGIIASRYMPSSQLFPPRPAIKRWGSKIVYEPLIWLLFGMSYYDYQCGAKLFKRKVIEKIVPDLTVRQWAFDVEVLYLCKLAKFTIKEWPTVWYDRAGSKLKLSSGFRMLGSLIKMRWHHTALYNFFYGTK